MMLVCFIFYVESFLWVYLEDFLYWIGISCNIFSENLDVSACRIFVDSVVVAFMTFC